jgi:K+-transporting ATPase ATPase C chain
MKKIFQELGRSAAATAALAVLLGGLYPLTVWVLAHGLYPARADGSLERHGGTVIGSRLIGQEFPGDRYFHSRPSAAGTGYDPLHSGGTNLGPLSRKLADDIKRRVEAYRRENGLPAGAPVPADAVTSSASGLDPDISPENARLQAPRVARARGLDPAAVLEAVKDCTRGRTLGLLGQPRVNVLELNLRLDARPGGEAGPGGTNGGPERPAAEE